MNKHVSPHGALWLDDLNDPPELPEQPLANVDVAIVGSGYTGLNAALQTSRGGRSTLVLETGELGHGCSTRNGGQISTSVKPSLQKLGAKYGLARAKMLRQEGETALEWIEDLIAREGIDCDFQRTGRFHAAHTPQHFTALVEDCQKLLAEENIDCLVVERGDQHRELGSDVYYGGVVFRRHASLHPGKYHRGLLDKAIAAGVHITANCAVEKIERNSDGFHLQTQKGPVKARDVIVATNGYTTSLTPWLQRRVIPIGSYVIATEELPADLMDRLFPTNRIVSDTCKVVYYYRPSTDRKRVVFGGRVSANESDPAISGPKLYKDMCRVFPELKAYGISHSWSGTVAYTFDEMAHVGKHDGMHYAMGYCGSGVSMASYLGMRLGQKVLGLADGQTAFDDLVFPTRPLYTGKPWFLPAAVQWYRVKDQLQRRFAAATNAH